MYVRFYYSRLNISDIKEKSLKVCIAFIRLGKSYDKMTFWNSFNSDFQIGEKLFQIQIDFILGL